MEHEQLRLFEGHKVAGATYRVAGQVDVDLPGMTPGATCFLLVEVRCEEVTFGPLNKKEPEAGLGRRHSLVVDRAVVFEDEFEARRVLEGLADALPPGDER